MGNIVAACAALMVTWTSSAVISTVAWIWTLLNEGLHSSWVSGIIAADNVSNSFYWRLRVGLVIIWVPFEVNNFNATVPVLDIYDIHNEEQVGSGQFQRFLHPTWFHGWVKFAMGLVDGRAGRRSPSVPGIHFRALKMTSSHQNSSIYS